MSGDRNGWIGIDFDGVLATWSGIPSDVLTVGAPIPRTVERVKRWLEHGRQVRILTARVAACGTTSTVACDDEAFANNQRRLIEAWCLEHLGQILPVTAVKDWEMDQFLDDHCVQMVPNTGISLWRAAEELHRLAAHYASLLNDYDGGNRNIGDDFNDWTQRYVAQRAEKASV